MRRIDAIKNIMDIVNDEIVVTSCGKISREVFYVKDRPRNFYVQGSMGMSLPLAMGVSLCKPDEKVVVIAGDGEILMELGSLVLLKKLQQEKKVNLDLYILDNNQYESTGGQHTVSDMVDFRYLCDCFVIFCKASEVDVPRINISHEKIRERFMNAIR
jgi:thiamine pyrophosphate-dependent acetolactate synthase large subunit-like protein